MPIWQDLRQWNTMYTSPKYCLSTYRYRKTDIERYLKQNTLPKRTALKKANGIWKDKFGWSKKENGDEVVEQWLLSKKYWRRWNLKSALFVSNGILSLISLIFVRWRFRYMISSVLKQKNFNFFCFSFAEIWLFDWVRFFLDRYLKNVPAFFVRQRRQNGFSLEKKKQRSSKILTRSSTTTARQRF